MFFISALVFVFAHADMNREFACYQAMNQKSRSAQVVLDNKIAIHPVNKYSFFKFTGEGMQQCRVPSGAPLAPDGKAGRGPWLMKFVYKNEHYHIQYPEVFEHLDIKGAPPWVTPECSASPGSVAKVLENRISESRQVCTEGPDFKPCLKEFFKRLAVCRDIAVIKTYVEEIERTSQHAGSTNTVTPPVEIGR